MRSSEGDVWMIVIGIDPHKGTHTAVAIDGSSARPRAERTVRARDEGFGELVGWARELDVERVWALEDCRHVSGALERFLLAHGETVIRISPQLMGDARRGQARERGKSDPIDALAVARIAVRDGIEAFPTARLAGPELEIRLLFDHRARLVAERTRLINDLRWHVFDLWPDYEIKPRTLDRLVHQQRLARRLQAAPASARVRVARDELRRVRELTRAINQLERELAALVTRTAPALAADRGSGPILTAAFVGEIAGITRFARPAKLARTCGAAPVPVWSGQSNGRLRLDTGGNRRLNHALHLYALSRIRHDPATAAYIAKQRARGKTHKDAMRLLKRQLVNRVWRLLQPDAQPQPTTLNC
jgi:transposase